MTPDGGDPNCIGGTLAAGAGAGEAAGAAGAAGDAAGAAGDAAGAADAPGDGIGDVLVDGAGDPAGVACATKVCPKFPPLAWPDGAATAVSPKLAVITAAKTPVLSRFKSSLLTQEYGEPTLGFPSGLTCRRNLIVPPAQ